MSLLKIESVELGGSPPELFLLRFGAVSNKNYTVQYRTELDSGPWSDLVSISAQPSHRVVTVTNPLSALIGSSYYRLVSPRQP